MKQSKDIMGMPITVEIVGENIPAVIFDKVFDYFHHVDDKFSTYKDSSEISKINRQEISPKDSSEEMKTVFQLSEETKQATNGYFEIARADGMIDPSGLVKGWAIYQASKILDKNGCENYFIEAGGDIQPRGKNSVGEKWSVGIRNPFNIAEIVKVVYVTTEGVATSGTYLRGQHIYNPLNREQKLDEIVSLTVIGPNIYEADRFATAAFAQGREGIMFIEKLAGFEGYMIDKNGIATETTGFKKYIQLTPPL